VILGIHHVAISVPDLKRALEFYCGVLGFEALWSLEVDGDDEASDRAIGLPQITVPAR
jgi:catechol 2,3-dioxygenase-like lactoylglutathione lyase family enzyme